MSQMTKADEECGEAGGDARFADALPFAATSFCSGDASRQGWRLEKPSTRNGHMSAF
jgi:hypothetical protein